MGSRTDERRHNDDFVALYHKSGMTQRPIAEALGVSLITVKTWCVDEGADMARDCPKWRVDAFKIFLGLKLKDLTPQQREEVLDIWRGIKVMEATHAQAKTEILAEYRLFVCGHRIPWHSREALGSNAPNHGG
jgi:hypothetical protein